MRTRNLKPGFFTNEVLAACPPEARLLFAGLWLLADREGRLEDRPLRIKAQLFPFDAWDVDALLTALSQRGFVRRYEVGGVRYMAIPKFASHQWPHAKEPSSVIPPPPGVQVITGNEQVENRTDPAFPNTPFLETFPDTPSRPGARPRSKSTEPAPGFEEFWSAYPKKVAKAKAVEAWNKIQPDHPLRARIMNALARQVSSADWLRDEGRYIPHPSTYLNQQRWEDELGNAAKTFDREAEWQRVRRQRAEDEAMKKGAIDPKEIDSVIRETAGSFGGPD